MPATFPPPRSALHQAGPGRPPEHLPRPGRSRPPASIGIEFAPLSAILPWPSRGPRSRPARSDALPDRLAPLAAITAPALPRPLRQGPIATASARTGLADARRRARIELRHGRLDELTGVYAREPGVAILGDEMARAHRLREPLVLGFITVEGLPAATSAKRRASRDWLMRVVAARLRLQLRSHDPIVRAGPLDLICAFTNTSMPAAVGQVKELRATLEHGRVERSISVRLVQPRPGEALEDLPGATRGTSEHEV